MGLLLVCLAAGSVGAAPLPRRMSPVPAPKPAPQPWTVSAQYTQFFDDQWVAIATRVLGPDHTFLFRYEQDWPDNHVFPNGVSMKQMHTWLTRVIDSWNREPLMPVKIRLERGQPETDNVINLDETGSETGPSPGLGGYSLSFNGDEVQFHSRASFNMTSGSLARWELVEATARHELGHCFTLRHSSSRASMMGYVTGPIDFNAAAGYIASDDLLGLRSVWARNSPGFGALQGDLRYPDGSEVGGGDVIAVDDETGEVVATGLSDRQVFPTGEVEINGHFRIELPAGRRVRLTAHPMHADAALFGEHYLPAELLSPGDFEPTELLDSDRNSVFLVPDGSTRDLGAFTVAPPADKPLHNQDAQLISLVPGERRHAVFQFDGLSSDPAQVRLSLKGLTAANIATSSKQVEFDVTASAGAAGVSTVELLQHGATNLQAGSLRVRPVQGLVRATGVDPISLTGGKTTDVTLHGIGLDRVTGVRWTNEVGTTELPTQMVGAATAAGLTVRVSPPAGASVGPWNLALLTADGEVPPTLEPQPRLWVGQGRIRAAAEIDLGDVPVDQPIQVSVPLTNQSTARYRVSSVRLFNWLGGNPAVESLQVSDLAPGATGPVRFTVTPHQLGPAVITFGWLSGSQWDAATVVRLWAVPGSTGR
jgi:hypothetical protein